MATNQEVIANFNVAKQRIQPAKLKDTHTNGSMIADYMRANSIQPTPEGFYDAINALYKRLDWDVQPEKLKKESSTQNIVENPLHSEAQRTELKKAEEAKAAFEKAEKIAEADVFSAINSYAPRDRNGRLLYSTQTSQQERLRTYVASQRTRGCTWQTILKPVKTEVARLNQQDEAKQERL